jgi:hypothetical protein
VDVVGYVIGADTDFGVHCSPSTQLWWEHPLIWGTLEQKSMCHKITNVMENMPPLAVLVTSLSSWDTLGNSRN